VTENIETLESMHVDLAAIESLYPEAFPDEDLLPLVRDLLQEARVALSLVATIDCRIVGHVIFTRCSVAGSDHRCALFGPLAVEPAWQRRGIGSAIVRDGLQRLEYEDVSQVFVLGDPTYYGRLGFLPESRVKPPDTLPPEWESAWQSQSLRGSIATPHPGKLSLPQPWLKSSLWLP
jgi:putative acetyltransferase